MTDIAWLAGLIEGEGSFGWRCSPLIQMHMCDKDVILRAAMMLGARLRGPYKPKGKDHYQEQWTFALTGSNAAAWMMTLYSFMGSRRRAKIEEVLMMWRDHPGFPKASPGTRLPALCHPERIRVAYGKCKKCYMMEWRAKYGKVKGVRAQRAVNLQIA